ncbi:MAG: polysaccharide deacetylase family protein [Flavobacteriales bacterium]|nr:polysaccharide deacetylase family protein [Flavobacteriales bacterium]
MYLVQPPAIIRTLGKNFLWRIKTERKEVFLTFDDGPEPTVTLPILEMLEKKNAHATFFCIGKQVEKHPDVFALLKAHGHAVGNHSHTHLNGWTVKTSTYVEDVMKCSDVVKSTLFRPPYGRITRQQSTHLQSLFRIVMWDVLSGDFDSTITPEKCMSNAMKNVRPGSIIVFHDSLKAKEKVLYVLPRVLDALQNDGYVFSAISGQEAKSFKQ